MKKATKEQMRESMYMASLLSKKSIRFIPVPVYDEEDAKYYLGIAMEKLLEEIDNDKCDAD